MQGLQDPAGKMDTPERSHQAHKLLELSPRVSEQSDLTVVCGDFNVKPDGETLDIFNRAGFTELVTAYGFEGTRSRNMPSPDVTPTTCWSTGSATSLTSR